MLYFLFKVAEKMSDPLCRGIFAGDTRLLSLRSCFPPVYQYEHQHGSIAKGVLCTKEGGCHSKSMKQNKRRSFKLQLAIHCYTDQS